MSATLSLFRPVDLRSPRRDAPTAAREPQLFYDPPYATPSEDALAWALVRALRPSCGLRHNVALEIGTYNFLIEHEGRTIGIEVSDESTDAPPASGADVSYRFLQRDVDERLADLLYVMVLLDPAFFDARSRIRARRESSGNVAIELNGDHLSNISLRYESDEQIVEIDGEWLVIDPDEVTYETRVIRHVV